MKVNEDWAYKLNFDNKRNNDNDVNPKNNKDFSYVKQINPNIKTNNSYQKVINSKSEESPIDENSSKNLANFFNGEIIEIQD